MFHVLYHKPLFNKLIIKNIIFLNDIIHNKSVYDGKRKKTE